MSPTFRAGDNLFWATRDHIIPANQGGTECFENLVAACRLCNSYRRSMPAEIFWIFASGRWTPNLNRKSFSGLSSYAEARKRRGDPIIPKRKPPAMVEHPGGSPAGERDPGQREEPTNHHQRRPKIIIGTRA
jgi:hypothetical protein